jgi:hypothetical protein
VSWWRSSSIPGLPSAGLFTRSQSVWPSCPADVGSHSSRDTLRSILPIVTCSSPNKNERRQDETPHASPENASATQYESATFSPTTRVRRHANYDKLSWVHRTPVNLLSQGRASPSRPAFPRRCADFSTILGNILRKRIMRKFQLRAGLGWDACVMLVCGWLG